MSPSEVLAGVSKNQCYHCSKTFKSVARLKKHSCRLVCKLCFKVLKSRDTYFRHLRTHSEDYKIYGCSHCSQKYGRREALSIHMQKVHSIDIKFNCPLCELQEIENCKDLVNHLKLCHTNNSQLFECDFCKQEFACNARNAYVLLNHKLTHKRDFLTDSAGKENEGNHQINSNTSYSQNILMNSSIGKVKSHQKNSNTYAGNALNKCDKVSLGLNRKSKPRLNEKAKKHLQCPECSKTFAYPSHLANHSKMHLKAQPHQCQICLKNFSSLQALRSHSIVHRERTHRCPYCPKAFLFAGHLNQHLVVHSRKRIICERKRKRLLGLSFQIDHYGSLRSSDATHLSINFHPKVVICSKLKHAINQLVQP